MPQRYSGGVCHPASIEILHISNFILAFQPFLEMSSSYRVEELWFFFNVSGITGELTSVPWLIATLSN